MLTLFTVRALLLVAALVAVGVAAAPAGGDDKKKDPPKLPPLDSKEWKKQGDKGLQVWDVTEGKGDAVKAGAMVTIHYTGWTTDGKVFDSSLKGGEPATFPLGNLIKGWQEGIPGMKEGGKRRLMIPSDLGYGDEGSPPDIPGKATLVFEIELIRNWSLPAPDAKEWKEVKDTGGLKTWDVKEGKGEAIKAGAEVTIHYTGWTLDGKIFDSSHKRGEPATFPLGDLIKGWQIGVPGMKPGGVRRLSIPYPLAYGEKGRPPTIPAKATLIFEIEAFETKK
jgi:peptidylprolyl isomerase